MDQIQMIITQIENLGEATIPQSLLNQIREYIDREFPKRDPNDVNRLYFEIDEPLINPSQNQQDVQELRNYLKEQSIRYMYPPECANVELRLLHNDFAISPQELEKCYQELKSYRPEWIHDGIPTWIELMLVAVGVKPIAMTDEQDTAQDAEWIPKIEYFLYQKGVLCRNYYDNFNPQERIPQYYNNFCEYADESALQKDNFLYNDSLSINRCKSAIATNILWFRKDTIYLADIYNDLNGGEIYIEGQPFPFLPSQYKFLLDLDQIGQDILFNMVQGYLYGYARETMVPFFMNIYYNEDSGLTREQYREEIEKLMKIMDTIILDRKGPEDTLPPAVMSIKRITKKKK